MVSIHAMLSQKKSGEAAGGDTTIRRTLLPLLAAPSASNQARQANNPALRPE